MLCKPKSIADATAKNYTTINELFGSDTDSGLTDDVVVLIQRTECTQIRELDWSTLRRCHLGLTQTCGLLRKEFLPIHQAHLPVVVALKDLASHVETFVRSGKVADIIVNLSPGLFRGSIRGFESWSNVKDFILLCAEAQAIKVRFKRDGYFEFQEIFRTTSNFTKFFEYIKTSVDSVHFREGSHIRCWQERERTGVPQRLEVRLYLTIKRQFEQGWMGDDRSTDYGQKLELWRQEMGVEGMNVHPRLVPGWLSYF